VQGGQLRVRVVNQSGHKLPTGYGEGRRMWINVRFYDGANNLVAERGAYDGATAVLTTSDTKVYEIEHGLDATQAAATGLPVGTSFHFVLNNKVFKDNRIPPRGFTNAGFAAAQSDPVAASYYEQQYWDDTSFAIPVGAFKATVTLYHQTSSKEYMDFLLATNTTNGDSVTAYNEWVAHGKSAPVQMASTSIVFALSPIPPPIPYGLAKLGSNGAYPELSWTGTPGLAANDFVLTVTGGLPGVFANLIVGPNTASTPAMGGTSYVGTPSSIVTTFQFDPSGAASVPILVTPGMVGSELNYQVIARDKALPQPYGLSNALHVTFTP
jgi:hypothetical protein